MQWLEGPAVTRALSACARAVQWEEALHVLQGAVRVLRRRILLPFYHTWPSDHIKSTIQIPGSLVIFHIFTPQFYQKGSQKADILESWKVHIYPHIITYNIWWS